MVFMIRGAEGEFSGLGKDFIFNTSAVPSIPVD